MEINTLGDGVAHVGTICDASSTTTMLAHCPLPIAHCPLGVAVHARLHLPLTTVVNLLSQRNAEFPGFHDRGVIAVGKKSDLNLVKLSRAESAGAADRARSARRWGAYRAEVAGLLRDFCERASGRRKR